MKSWFVAHTQALKESMAQQHLLEQGFEAYIPRYKKTRRHARKVTEVLAPLFPRYIFVAIDLETDCWRRINGTRGVAYLLMNDERPAVVPVEVIAGLKQQEDEHGVVPIDSMDAFVKGDKVRVLEGAFKDYSATFEALDDKQRVQILLSFLGRETRISLPHYAVEAA